MKTPESILRALECCKSKGGNCNKCPYVKAEGGEASRVLCYDALHQNASELILSLLNTSTAQEPAEAPEPWTREKVLAEAKRCVCGQREQDYGTPERSFDRIAALWSVYMGTEFTATNVAIMMALLKIARIAENPQHMDSWVDGAGSFACGGEIAGEEAQRND